MKTIVLAGLTIAAAIGGAGTAQAERVIGTPLFGSHERQPCVIMAATFQRDTPSPTGVYSCKADGDGSWYVDFS